ncbi:MAG: gamma-glutamyltransferase [Proteobacteria bacterium]|nr:gamma-glutamyltransferase [Pseudomonadota bacterium]MDA0992008.1 gamma-glutamyltransferase [Pseudomonadota bacterium]
MKRCISLFLLLFILGCSPTERPDSGAATSPETAADATPRSWAKGGMATAANPHAVAAAIEMLEKGGHAVDAAIAAHAVLGLVEPQSSGIGGGGFMLVYEYDGSELTFHEGREIAPAGATIDMFMRDGVVMEFMEAWQSGKAVGVPGAVALYRSAHDQHGKLPWEEIFAPAIRLATEGFVVSPRLADYLPRMAQFSQLAKNPATAAYFYPGGEPLKAGDLLKNPEYAATLTRIAKEGISAFYTGEIAEAIAAAAQAEPNGGTLTAADIEAYKPVTRPVICGEFRDLSICTSSPPSSGGAQIMIAGLYDHLSADATNQSDRIAAFVDAQRLAYADRDHYFGDPDEIDIPLDDLLDPVYLKHRATERFAPGANPTPGDPGLVFDRESTASLWAPDTTEEAAGTTHLSVIDNEGNAVSMTATVEAPFGSSRWAAGFLLNNEMTDFAREVPTDGSRLANAITPGRRPRSSMSPSMVFDDTGNLVMVTGSPGGNSIPAYVAKTLVGVLDWGLSAQDAVDHPNIVARGETVRVEINVEPGQSIANDLKERGYNVRESDGENSGLHIIVVNQEGLDGAADKRREGLVAVPASN